MKTITATSDPTEQTVVGPVSGARGSAARIRFLGHLADQAYREILRECPAGRSDGRITVTVTYEIDEAS